MRKLLRITAWILAAAVIVIAVLFAYLRNADLSVYEKQIEGFLSEAIGHKLDVDGLFVLRFGKKTHLTAEEIHLSNPDWTADPVIVSAGHVSVTVDIWSLISGPIIVEDLDIREVRIRLEKDEAGQANWATGRVRDESKPEPEFERGLIAFRDVEVQDVRFTYLDPGRRRPLDVALEKLTVIPDQNHILDLDLTAVVNEIPVWADGKLGPWENLIDGNNIVADLDMTLGQVRIGLNGSVENLPKLVGTELSLNISGPAIDRITDRLGLPPFSEGAFEIDGRIIKLDSGNQLRLDGNLGAIDLFASGTTNSLLRFDTAQLDFNFSGPDTKYIAEVFGIKDAPAVPFLMSGDLNKAGKRVTFAATRVQLGENTLGFEGWLEFESGIPDGDLVLNASGPDFSVVGPFAGVPNVPAEAFQISGRVQKTGKSAQFDDVMAVVGQNRISAHGSIGENGSADTQISFSASGPDISILGPMMGLEGIQARPFDVSAIVKPDRAGIRIENAKADFGEIQLAVDGIVGTTEGMTGTELKATAEGSDLRYVALLAGVPYLPEGPFSMGVRARIGRNELRLSEGTAEVGGINGSVNGTVSLGADAGAFGLDLSVSGPDLGDALAFEWLDRMSGEAFMVKGRVNHRSGVYGLKSIIASIGDFEMSLDGNIAVGDLSGKIVLNASAPDAEELGELIGVTHLPEGPLSIGGRVEKRGGLFEFTDAVASVGDYSIGVDGTLSTSPMSNRSDLQFSGSGPKLFEVGRIFDYEELPARPFSFSGEVNGIPTGFALERFVAKIGDNDIVGGFSANLEGKPEVTGGLTSSFLDLRKQLAGEESDTADKEPVTDGRLFSDEPLDAGWLNTANIDFALKTDRLILGFGDVRDFSIGVKIRDGVLDIEPISFRETGGSVAGNFHMAPAGDGYKLDAAMKIDNMHLGLLGAADQDRATAPPIGGEVNLTATGRSPHALMASLNGKFALTQESGRLKDLMTSRLFGDIVLQIIQTLNPLQKAREFTILDCGIYTINIVDGFATIETFAMQTDRMSFVARGNINFKDERLNLTMNVAPRAGLGISIGGVANSFLKLGGTLRTPQIQIDPTASVATTGAAVATGGISILAKGLWDRVKAETDICKDLGRAENGK